MNVFVDESVYTKESLLNQRPWFNGVKTFSSVKISPPPVEELPLQQEETPSSLDISVIDTSSVIEKIS